MGLNPEEVGGSPKDEYDMEIAKIVSFLIHNLEDIKLNKQILINEINKIWQENFEEKCKNVEQITIDIVKKCV